MITRDPGRIVDLGHEYVEGPALVLPCPFQPDCMMLRASALQTLEQWMGRRAAQRAAIRYAADAKKARKELEEVEALCE